MKKIQVGIARKIIIGPFSGVVYPAVIGTYGGYYLLSMSCASFKGTRLCTQSVLRDSFIYAHNSTEIFKTLL